MVTRFFLVLVVLVFLCCASALESGSAFYQLHDLDFSSTEDWEPTQRFMEELSIWNTPNLNETHDEATVLEASYPQGVSSRDYELKCLDSHTLWYLFQNRANSQRGGKYGSTADVESTMVFTSGIASVNCWREQWVAGNTQRNLLFVIRMKDVSVQQTPVKQDNPEILGRGTFSKQDVSADFVNPVFVLMSSTGHVIRAYFHSKDSVKTIDLKKKFISDLETSIVKNSRIDITPVGKVQHTFTQTFDKATGNIIITKERDDRSFVTLPQNVLPPNKMRQHSKTDTVLSKDGRMVKTESHEQVEYGGTPHGKREHEAFAKYKPKTEPNTDPQIRNPERGSSSFNLFFRKAVQMGILEKSIAFAEWDKILKKNANIKPESTEEGFDTYNTLAWSEHLSKDHDVEPLEGYTVSSLQLPEDHSEDDIHGPMDIHEQIRLISLFPKGSRPLLTKTKVPKFYIHNDWIESDLSMTDALYKKLVSSTAKKIQKTMNLEHELDMLRQDPSDRTSGKNTNLFVSYHPITSLPILMNAYKAGLTSLTTKHNDTICHFLEKIQTLLVVSGAPEAQQNLIETVNLAKQLKFNQQSSLMLIAHAVLSCAHLENPTEETSKWLLLMTHFTHEGEPFKPKDPNAEHELQIRDNAYLVYANVATKIPKLRKEFLEDLERKIRDSVSEKDREFFIHAFINAGKHVDVSTIRALVLTPGLSDEFKALSHK